MYQGTWYAQSNPQLRWLSGWKHFGIHPHMKELEPHKVMSLGLHHPVFIYIYPASAMVQTLNPRNDYLWTDDKQCSGLIYSKGLQNDRPKWRVMYADPRWITVWKALGKTMLDWGENRRCLSSLLVTWLLLGVGCAFIPHLKEKTQGYLLI